MANETIYGCVTWPGGVVTFDQDPNCQYTACVDWTGIHAGQVAVTINTATCDDIYYGCVDWATNKFEVSVPDSCCWESYLNCPCNLCEISGIQPFFIKITFTGIQDVVPGCRDIDGGRSWDVFGTLAVKLNREFTLSSRSPLLVCSYVKLYTTDVTLLAHNYSSSSNCTGGFSNINLLNSANNDVNLTLVNIGGGNFTLVIDLQYVYTGGFAPYAFRHESIIAVDELGQFCMPTGIYTSNNTAGSWNENLLIKNSGTCFVSIPSTSEGNYNLCTD